MHVVVRVIPKARKERFGLLKNGEFSAAVKEAPERNQVNDRVQYLIARHFSVPVTHVRFITGERSRKKTFDVVE